MPHSVNVLERSPETVAPKKAPIEPPADITPYEALSTPRKRLITTTQKIETTKKEYTFAHT